MKKFHDYLASKISWYRKWHEQPMHKEAHWLAFILFVVFIMGCSASINKSLTLDEQNSPENSLASVAIGGIHVNKNLNSNPGQTKIKPPFPTVALAKAVRSDEAIAALGDKLADVASWYGNTPDQLKGFLKNDKDLWVDKKGKLFYADAGLAVQGTAAGSEPQGTMPIGGSFPLSQTLFLHSNPGSTKVLYLDFNGAVVSNTVWNASYNSGQPINAPAFSLDGDPTTFNDSELQMIQNIWMRVAEDYAPFDLDVTTEEPPAGYLNKPYNNRDIITPDNFYPNAGGVSYIGQFDDSSDYYKNSWVFSNMLQNGEKYIAEACSHENGHAVGLHHEGTTSGVTYYLGQGNWAPIMGNSYYAPVTQWAKGEYTGANNTEDQLQVMQSYGLKFYPDDHGNTTATAGQLTLNGTVVTGQGIIEQRTDVDVFKFVAGAGPVSISVTPAVLSGAGDLNIKAELRDGSGTVLASSDPSGLPASISATVPGGTYYLFIDGVGEADPATTGYSDYASLGQYFINGTIVSSGIKQPPVAAISASPISGNPPLNVQFSSNGSTDPDGSIVSYGWNFGDGSTSAEQNPSKTFSSPGNYTATLTITDNDNLSDSKSVSIAVANKAPTAVINASPLSGGFPLAVSFNGSGSSDPDGTIASYEWDYGDNSTGTGVSSSHNYSAMGTYTAQLTVTDNGGAQSSVATNISVSDPNVIQAPTNLRSSLSGSTVTLSWTDNSTNESGFYVERALKGKGNNLTYTQVGQVGASVKTYTETVAVGTYYYRVRAFGSTGNTSTYSNSIQATRRK